jgi:MFS family permease
MFGRAPATTLLFLAFGLLRLHHPINTGLSTMPILRAPAPNVVPKTEFHHASGRQFRPIIILYFLVVCLGSISYGYSASVISTTLVQPGFIAAMQLDQKSNAKTLIGLTGSMYQLGGLLGTFTVAFFSDRYGRRIGIAVPAVLGIIAAALLAGSVDMNMFIAMRFLSGVAAYNIVASVPTWMAEVAPPNVRGMFVDLHGTFLLIGYAIAAYVGYGFYKLNTPGSWRAQQALNALPNILLLIGLNFLPESPRWLLMENRPDEAKQVLDRLHTSQEAAVEFDQISKQVQIDKKLDSSYWAFFTKKSYRKRAIICFTIPAGIQLAGPIGESCTSP